MYQAELKVTMQKMSSNLVLIIIGALVFAAVKGTNAAVAERGEIGDFITLEHEVSGAVHILSSRIILLQNFNYDGQGPDTVLYIYAPGEAVDPRDDGGVVIPLPTQFGDDEGRFQMRRYSNEDILVTLPEGNSTCDIGTLTVWCRSAGSIFGQIEVPRSAFVNNGMEPCASIGSAEVGVIQTLDHEVSGTLRILDSRTIYIENFNYDGQGPDTVLYSYAPGEAVDPVGGGVVIPLPQSSGDSEGRFLMRRYTNEGIVVTLPEGLSTCDIGALTVWCRQARVIFGQIEVPRTTYANDGASPCTVIGDGSGGLLLNAPEFDNCIPLHETLQLSWRVDNANSQVRFRLCGCQSIDPNINQYMGFGLSGSNTQTLMFGADPTITWVDSETGQANAVDYHLSAYTQCRAGEGACPDTMDSSGTCTNDVSDVTGSASEGRQCVSFTKPFSTSDSTCDLALDPTNEEQYIVWGVGGLGETAFKHFTRADAGDAPIHLGRTPRDGCSGAQLVCRSCPPFQNDRIIARESTTFQARIGPSGSERGYMGITGHPGWGIAWYINGTLIPELVVERGKTYTFLIEGGDNPGDLTNYHPFYITDSIAGGRLQNTQEVQDRENVFSGFDENGRETGVGELCKQVETALSETMRQNCADLNTYTDSLLVSGSCSSNSGQPGRLFWTPDETTPDVVYYQCATHLNLGWRILVLDEGELLPGEQSHGVTTTSLSLLMVTVIGLIILSLL